MSISISEQSTSNYIDKALGGVWKKLEKVNGLAFGVLFLMVATGFVAMVVYMRRKQYRMPSPDGSVKTGSTSGSGIV